MENGSENNLLSENQIYWKNRENKKVQNKLKLKYVEN